jgi:hypothetical protein
VGGQSLEDPSDMLNGLSACSLCLRDSRLSVLTSLVTWPKCGPDGEEED